MCGGVCAGCVFACVYVLPYVQISSWFRSIFGIPAEMGNFRPAFLTPSKWNALVVTPSVCVCWGGWGVAPSFNFRPGS